MQKKILLAIVILFSFTTAVNAQIKKGAVLLGGGLGFTAQKSTSAGSASGKQTNITVMPAFGKAIKDNLVVGADINYSYYKNDNSYTAKSNTYGLGVFIRQYKELGKGFYLFGQARSGASYNKQNNHDYNNGNSTDIDVVKGFTVQAGLYPGIAYAVSKKFQLETGFNNLVYAEFDHSKSTPFNTSVPETKTNSFSLGTSLSNFSGVTIGFRVLLN